MLAFIYTCLFLSAVHGGPVIKIESNSLPSDAKIDDAVDSFIHGTDTGGKINQILSQVNHVLSHSSGGTNRFYAPNYAPMAYNGASLGEWIKNQVIADVIQSFKDKNPGNMQQDDPTSLDDAIEQHKNQIKNQVQSDVIQSLGGKNQADGLNMQDNPINLDDTTEPDSGNIIIQARRQEDDPTNLDNNKYERFNENHDPSVDPSPGEYGDDYYA